jgi:hypothetical protein
MNDDRWAIGDPENLRIDHRPSIIDHARNRLAEFKAIGKRAVVSIEGPNRASLRAISSRTRFDLGKL